MKSIDVHPAVRVSDSKPAHSGPSRSATVSVHTSLAALKRYGGADTATVDLGRPCHFLAWGAVTLIAPRPEGSQGPNEDAVVLDIYTADRRLNSTQLFGGPYHDPEDPPTRIFNNSHRGYDQHVTFLLRSLPGANVDSYAIGIVLKGEDDPD
ncbi:MAG TPA: hypothetical protein QGF05_07615 [Dehalococcoidia bacterium]|nr:hypothetical protein [Dehalococcoidia bacterium]